MLTTAIKEGKGTLLQNRETWSIDQDVTNNLANSFKASSDLFCVTIMHTFRDGAARLHM